MVLAAVVAAAAAPWDVAVGVAN